MSFCMAWDGQSCVVASRFNGEMNLFLLCALRFISLMCCQFYAACLRVTLRLSSNCSLIACHEKAIPLTHLFSIHQQ